MRLHSLTALISLAVAVGVARPADPPTLTQQLLTESAAEFAAALPPG